MNAVLAPVVFRGRVLYTIQVEILGALATGTDTDTSCGAQTVWQVVCNLVNNDKDVRKPFPRPWFKSAGAINRYINVMKKIKKQYFPPLHIALLRSGLRPLLSLRSGGFAVIFSE